MKLWVVLVSKLASTETFHPSDNSDQGRRIQQPFSDPSIHNKISNREKRWVWFQKLSNMQTRVEYQTVDGGWLVGQGWVTIASSAVFRGRVTWPKRPSFPHSMAFWWRFHCNAAASGDKADIWRKKSIHTFALKVYHDYQPDYNDDFIEFWTSNQRYQIESRWCAF